MLLLSCVLMLLFMIFKCLCCSHMNSSVVVSYCVQMLVYSYNYTYVVLCLLLSYMLCCNVVVWS